MKAAPRKNYGRIPNLVELKDLIATQIESFVWFKSEGLRELFDEINPITDYTGKNFELRFLDYEFGEPKFSVEECRNRDMTYAAPLRIRTRRTLSFLAPCRVIPALRRRTEGLSSAVEHSAQAVLQQVGIEVDHEAQPA